MSLDRMKIASCWKLRHKPLWRSLIRAYIGNEKGGGRVALNDMPAEVAKYWKHNDDYVIGPGLSHYLKLMLMDTNLDRLLTLGVKIHLEA